MPFYLPASSLGHCHTGQPSLLHECILLSRQPANFCLHTMHISNNGCSKAAISYQPSTSLTLYPFDIGFQM
jgi:hypothetical protein